MNTRPLLALALGLLAGCGPSTPPPDNARPVDDGVVAADLPTVAGEKPAQSEPAAATLVNAVLMAHTKSQPSLVEKLKKTHIKRRGTLRLANIQSNATMEIFIWDDHYRATYAVESLGNIPQTFAYKGNAGWKLIPQLDPQPTPWTQPDQENALPDIRGDRLALLFPLADPKLVAVTARPSKDGSDPILRVWVGDAPPMLLSIEHGSNRLKRIGYEGKENGQTMGRALELFDFDTVAGVLLPKRVNYGVTTVQLTTWDKVEYEVPGIFETTVFDKP